MDEIQNLDFVGKVKGFLLNPIETFKKVKEEPLGESFRYFIVLLLIYSTLNALVLSATLNTMLGSIYSVYQEIPFFGSMIQSGYMLSIPVFFILFLIFGIIGIFIGGGVIHLGVILFGGKRGYTQTVKALLYSSTPSYLFGWIPTIGLIFGIWAFVLEIFGIKELQDMSTGRAIAAIIIPALIIGVILTIIIAAAVFMYVSNMTGVTPGI